MKTLFVARSIYQAMALMCIILMLFVLWEPAISRGATTTSSQFTISQLITGEVAFTTVPSNVTMSPSLGGITGGTSLGGTQFIITSGNTAGYVVTLTASSSLGMIGNASSTNYIPAYAFPGSTTPQFTFTVPANKAYFGYSVEASTTADLTQLFKDDGSSLCGTGSSDTVDACWLNASSSAVTILSRTSATPSSGATTTLKFRVTINANPNPTLPNDTYVATTTLTATAN